MFRLPPLAPVWPVVVAYLMAVVLIFVATTGLVFGVALSRAGGHPAHIVDDATEFALSPTGIMASALVSASMLVIVTLIAARLQARDIGSSLRLAPTRASLPGMAAAMFGMMGLSLATGATCDLLGLQGQGTMAAIGRALERPPPARFVFAIVTIAIAPAVAEESFFRGLIQTRLRACWTPWPSIVATALAFGLVHLDLVQGSVAFVAGVFLGWVAERFDGIRPGIGAHAVNNAAFVALASWRSSAYVTRAGDLWVIGVGSALCLASTALLRSPRAIQRSYVPPDGRS